MLAGPAPGHTPGQQRPHHMRCSEEARLDALGDPSNFGDIDENDPKSVARLMRKMGKEMGDEFGGPEFDQAVEELERGGDLGGEDDMGGGGGDDGDL